MKSRAREQASSSIPLRGRHERGAEKNGKQMRSQVASRSENHDGKQQDMTTHEQNAKSDRQTRPEPAHNSHKSKTNDTPRPPRVRPRGQERERKKWSIWYYVVQFSSVVAVCTSVGRLRGLPVGPHLRRGVYANTSRLALLQDPAAPRVYATLEIAGVCGSGHEWPLPPGGCETAPCFDQRAMSLERGSGLGQVLLGSSRGSNECFCI